MIALRAARTDELPTCASLWLATVEETSAVRERDLAGDFRDRFAKYFAARIARDEARYVVALDGDQIVGTAGALLTEGYPAAIHGLPIGYIFAVFVAPTHRQRGIATALTREVIAFLKGKECRRIRLHASPFARPMYEKMGFVPTSEMELRGNEGPANAL